MSKRLLNLCLTALLSIVCTAAWAQSKVDGVYQISSANDFNAFAELVNDGDEYAAAVLTQDIDLGTKITQIGCDAHNFRGTFDGAGHTLTINLFSTDAEGSGALFRNIGGQGMVRNLKVQGTITTTSKEAAGIVAWNRGTISGCWIDITIKSSVAGDGTHAGIAGVGNRGAVYEDCLVKIVLEGAGTTNCGGVNGWASDPVTVANCLVINDGSSFNIDGGSGTISRNDGNLKTIDLAKYKEEIYNNRPDGASANNYATNAWGNTKTATIVNADELASGKICYQLNTDQSRIGWVQEIGKDAYPVPAAFGTAQVYASEATGCDGKAETELTYSNNGTALATAHAYDQFGICHECGAFNFHALERDVTAGAYLLKSKADIDIAEGLNRVQQGAQFNLKMANDIEYVGEPGRYIFNTGNWFDGNFDGDGHALTIELTEMGGSASIFPNFSGNFKNAILHGSITTKAGEKAAQYVGSVTGHTRNDRVHISNVYSDVNINTNSTADNTTGGFIGVVETKTWIDNCIYAGNINCADGAECLASFGGWASNQFYVTNSAFIGSINNASGDSYVICRNPNNVVTTNVYWIDDFGLNLNHADGNQQIENPDMTIKDGELAYLLNGKQNGLDRFYQKLGEDPTPMPIKKEGALVYANAAQYRCDGQPVGSDVTYSNTNGAGVLPPHQFEDGFCSECGHLQEDFLTPVDGWFEISNGAELTWWSHYATTHLGCNARLTDDIDMSEYSENYANVGTQGEPFYGNFDGQFHTISNLILDRPGVSGVGLIACMNSLPSANRTADGKSISDADARKAEGSYIKNVALDNTCAITGYGYVALVGMTTQWAGHVTIEGVMMEGDVSANGGPNAAGVFGCVMGSTCHVTINRCGMTGNVYGPKENGSFSGWLGSYAEVSNCFAVGEVEGIESEERYFARYDGGNPAKLTNCYARYGKQPSVGIVSEEDFESGALAWKANGEQFRNSVWYQTIGEDAYPYADPSHGTVIYTAEQYFSVADDDDLAEVISETQQYIHTDLDEAVATVALVEKAQQMIDDLSDVTSIAELADAFDALAEVEKEVKDNEAIYATFKATADKAKTYLDENEGMQGEISQALRAYLTDNKEPDEDNTLGTAAYILEEHTATAEEIKAETKRVEEWLAAAVASDYVPGTDVTNMLVNADFSKDFKEGWTGELATSTGKVHTDDEVLDQTVGVEAWDKAGTMTQTVEGLKPGYYLVAINAAYRPSNDRYTYNYGAGIAANGNFNFFPTVVEDIVAPDDVEEQVNVNLEGDGAHDLAIYSDYHTTSAEDAEAEGLELLGYAVHGPSGMAAAANAKRYQVYTIGQVTEDGKLTIEISNPGAKYGNDWTGWANLKVTFLGEQAGEGLATVIENMQERANTILNIYEPETAAENLDGFKAAPNFPAELKTALEGYANEAASIDLVAKYSEAFQNIYAGKQAYLNLMRVANDLLFAENANLPLAERDEETGEWIASEENYVFSEDESAELYNAGDELQNKYLDGSASIEEALNPNIPENLLACIAPQDEEGFYLVGTPKQLLFFRAVSSNVDYKASAKLTDNIDLTGIAMQPINQWDYSYRGTFDGQGYAIENVWIDFLDQERTGLFNTIDQATIKNLKVTGDFYSTNKFIGGIAGYAYNAKVQNCDIAVNIHSTVEGDGTHGGVIGNNAGDGTVVENCIIRGQIFGDAVTNCGGVIGWSGSKSTVRNNIVLTTSASGKAIEEMLSRNGGNCDQSNNFMIAREGGSQGTIVTEEQLASGEVAYKLNGSKSEDCNWFQTIGVDAMPKLWEGSIVYSYGGKYMNEKPNPQLNAFAYNVRRTATGVKYILNAEAESVSAVLTDGTEVTIATDVKAGSYSANVEGEVASIKVVGKGSLDVVKIGESVKVLSPYGLDINNNPASKNFGQILMTETRPLSDHAGMVTEEIPGALAAFTPALELQGGYYGGLEFKAPLVISSDYKFGLKDVRFSKDGRLFVANASGETNSSIYEINPENLDEAWTPIFKGGELDAKTGITYVDGEEQNRMAVGLALEGEGENLKMYVLGAQRSDGGFNYTDYNCSIYNLGTAKEWTAAPSANYENLEGVYTIAPGHAGIHEDGQGGLWYLQYRSNPTAEQPSAKHWNAEGVEDYSNATKATYGSKMAISTDGNNIAWATGEGTVTVFETNYVPMANGQIFLENKYQVKTTENQITGLAFDYAGNLVVASSGSKTMSYYTTPSQTKNVVVTPVVLDAEGVDGDVNGDGAVTIKDVVAVLEIMAADGFNAAADVNGDGAVTIKDVVAVLEIMAAQ